MTAKRLDRYLARRFSTMVLMIVVAASLVVLLVQYVEVLRRFSDEPGFTTLNGLWLSVMQIPSVLDTALPFAFLFGALLSLLGLSRQLELVVARASGVSVWGFLKGPFFVALLVGVLASGLLHPLALVADRAASSLEGEMAGSAGRTDRGRWFRQDGPAGSSIIRSTGVDRGGLTLLGVTAFVFGPDGGFREKVSAPRAEFLAGRWQFTDAQIVSASDAPRQVTRYELPASLTEEEMTRSLATTDAVSLWSLPGVIQSADRLGLNIDRLRLLFHQLLNRPLFMAAMVMIAATVSLRLSRFGGALKLLLTGVVTGFLLYVLTEIVGDFGANGIINPVLAAWLPPVVALTFGATALLYQEDG
jgi:lipopolysaccharide export system permease protein